MPERRAGPFFVPERGAGDFVLSRARPEGISFLIIVPGKRQARGTLAVRRSLLRAIARQSTEGRHGPPGQLCQAIPSRRRFARGARGSKVSSGFTSSWRRARRLRWDKKPTARRLMRKQPVRSGKLVRSERFWGLKGTKTPSYKIRCVPGFWGYACFPSSPMTPALKALEKRDVA